MDIKGTIQATLDLIAERGNALSKLHPCAGLSYRAKHAFERRAHTRTTSTTTAPKRPSSTLRAC